MRAAGQPLTSLPPEISETPVATHQIRQGDWAVGRTLVDLNLRAETGALVIALHRNSRYLASPSLDLQLDDGDVLYLVGDSSDILLAREHLTRGA